MKKLAVILVFMVCGLTSGMAQKIVINYQYVSNYGELVSEKFECDSFYYHKSEVLTYKNGELRVFDNCVTSIETAATEENVRRLETLGNYQSGILKRKCRNAAIGNFVAGASIIVIGNIVADTYYDNKTDDLAEKLANGNIKSDSYNSEIKSIKTNTKVIRYVSTGIGAIFEIVGIVKTLQLADGSAFSYGINNNGVTVSYKFR